MQKGCASRSRLAGFVHKHDVGPGNLARCGLTRHGQWNIINKVVDSSSTLTAHMGVLDENTREGRRELLGGNNNNYLNSGCIEENRRVWACRRVQEPQEPAVCRATLRRGGLRWGEGALDRADLVVRAGIMRLAQPLRKPNRGCLSGSGGGEKGGRPGNSGVSALSGRSRATSTHRRTISPFLPQCSLRASAEIGDVGG